MRPTHRQIELAAYQRWERRHGVHGGDHDDWSAAEKDLTFGLSYRYIARHRLDVPIVLGDAERRRCRYCERSAPLAEFDDAPLLPSWFGSAAIHTHAECRDCRAPLDAALVRGFESFARPLMDGSMAPPRAGLPIAALKALIRGAIALMPAAELDHFADAIEWLTNPDHAQDAPRLRDRGCHVYFTPTPIAAPFAALARRVDDDAPWPYMLFFLAASRVVFQIHLPFSPRDEDQEDGGFRGPELSMSLGHGPEHRASRCVFVPVARSLPARVRLRAGVNAASA